jgi:large subunit ribosomal protein L25
MQSMKLSAEPRTDSGKGAVRRLRATGRIPAVAYGPKLEAIALTISPKDVTAVLSTERGRNSVIELSVGNEKKLTVLLADFQYHPVTRSLLHADFREIKEDEPIDVDVPFETTGKAKGVIAGGVLRMVYRKLPLRCLPALVPAKITHDVSELELDHSIPAKDLKLPEGVSVRLPPEQTVVAVAMEKKQPDEAEAAAPGAAAAAGAAPAAGAAAAAGAAGAAAPAAGAAAPAAGGKGAAPAGKGGKK